VSDEQKNYFQLFSLLQEFDLDPKQLKQIYRQQQEAVHPDRFADSSEDEKLHSIQATSRLNQAYETLASPQLRAAYLLLLNGVDVEDVSQQDLSPELLMGQIQLREQLEEVVGGSNALDELAQLRSDIEIQLGQSQHQFSEKFGASELGAAKSCYYEMQYLGKLLSEIEAAEERLLDY